MYYNFEHPNRYHRAFYLAAAALAEAIAYPGFLQAAHECAERQRLYPGQERDACYDAVSGTGAGKRL